MFTRHIFAGLALLLCASQVLSQARSITCLGRLEPRDGIINLAGPSNGSGVIQSLDVEKGDWVEAGDRIALLDTHALRLAEVKRLEALVKNAQSELKRQENLSRTSATSRVNLDDAIMHLEVSQAELAAARAYLDLTTISAPVRAQVLDIHARPGEQIGTDGVVELGRTDQMYVIAEVYETDIANVHPGQKATISLPALSEPLTGVVEDTELSVSRTDVIGTDPIARTDARVVEVRILLDDSSRVARFTNMQVEVEINP
ncbi:efflux RND transporter periplasmic adaptor subunit [Haliea sp. E17]|uniref:efflux RND transporter periplasmic adaptor subunit n=1 Tax=Haliea sp. E17 TaxID=3401576 RepID=UPI003AAA6306